jgi:hypothetical protein
VKEWEVKECVDGSIPGSYLCSAWILEEESGTDTGIWGSV